MRKEINRFPEESAVLTHILVVKDTDISSEWYEKVLGAEIYRQYDASVVIKFLDNWILLVEEGGPTEDKPNVSMVYPKKLTDVEHALTIRVKDCLKVYKELSNRGAVFLTSPVSYE